MITKALRNNRSVYTRGRPGPGLAGGGGTGRWSTSWTSVTSRLLCPIIVGTSTHRLGCGNHDDVVVAASDQAQTRPFIYDRASARQKSSAASGIAAWVAFLASDRSSYATGSSFVVDSGLMLSSAELLS